MPHPIVRPSGPADWTAYALQDPGCAPEDPFAHLHLTQGGWVGVSPDEGNLPYGGDAPEYTALFWDLTEAITSLYVWGERLRDRFDPAPRVSRGTQE